MYVLKTTKTIQDSRYNFIDTSFDIVKETQQECLEEFFKLNNRLKYCNGHFYSLIHQEDRDAYSKWLNILNYSRCGGDMW